MTKFKLNLIAATAALIAASATASAQNALSANVPFDFKISSRTVLPAGDYAILHENARLWVFENRESGYKAMAALGVPIDSRRTDPAQLVFRCHERKCSLSKIQVGHGAAGYEVPSPKSNSGGDEVAVRMAPLSRGNAE